MNCEHSGSFSRLLNCCYVLISITITPLFAFPDSPCTDAPARLKKELDSVLKLQSTIDTTDDAISCLADRFSKSSLESLNRTQERLKEKVELLYSSLNIPDSFPELENIDLEFVRLLVLARDLKINIRKRAIGSFFEWDRLDQAAGGRQQAIGSLSFLLCLILSTYLLIGTKIHQSTRDAIAKHKPALLKAIKKFNGYCEQLATSYHPEWELLLPEALPVKLDALRNSPSLMEDVWITRTAQEVPRWLDDINVRAGIRAMLKLDHCLEERRRLGQEVDNLCRWFGQELIAIEAAIASPSSELVYNTQLRNLTSIRSTPPHSA